MPKIARTRYGGVWPSSPAESDGTIYATDGVDADISDASLRPMRAPRQVSESTGKSMFLDGCVLLLNDLRVYYAHNSVGGNVLYRTGANGYPEVAYNFDAVVPGTSATLSIPATIVWHRLGVPAPTNPLVAMAVNSSVPGEDEEVVDYVYAYANDKDEIGPPSLPSQHIVTNLGAPRLLSGIEWPEDSWRVTHANIYVSAIGTKTFSGNDNKTESAYRYVGTASVGDVTFLHDGISAGMTLETLLYDPPPSDLTSIAFSPEANVLGGLSPSTGYAAFSEPFMPHAFSPDTYVRFGDTPRRMLCNDAHWFVLTDGRPYVLPLLPNDGPTRKPDRQFEVMPLIADRSAAAFAGGVIYASRTGLVMFSNTGRPVVVTYPIIRAEDWLAIQPHLMVGAVHNGYYYGGTPVAAFRFKLNTGDHPLKAADEWMWLSIRPTAFYVERTGALYYTDATGTHRWADGEKWLTYRWQGSFVRPSVPMAVHWGQVGRADIGVLTVRHYSDGDIVFERDMQYSFPYRLPGGATSRTVGVEFEGDAIVFSDAVATNIKDFA